MAIHSRDALFQQLQYFTGGRDAGTTLVGFLRTASNADPFTIVTPAAGLRVALYKAIWAIQNLGPAKIFQLRSNLSGSPTNFCRFPVPVFMGQSSFAAPVVWDFADAPVKLEPGVALEGNIDSGFSGNAFLTIIYKVV